MDLSTLRAISAKTPEDVQIRLAETAAPPEVASKASIYVLRPNGYALARKGTNAFTCFVDRQHLDTLEPQCMDAEGTATRFLPRIFAEKQRAAGVPEKKIDAAIEEGYRSGQFKAPRRPGIIYMLSDYNYIFDDSSRKVVHVSPHLMFYAPGLRESDVGSGAGAPFLTHPGAPDNLMIVVPRPAHTH
ncbi:MAG TPA: hypothetical protein VJ853_13440 [Thermoanaerobaculia bacterium]|nr:hypothetical protein [Thermoanaerobaculia bacterium]